MKIAHVVGTRPNFMKVSPVMAALRSSGTHQILVHTGQHYDRELSEAFFDDLELPYPDHFLGVGSGTHAAQLAAVISRLEPVLRAERPDAVLVPGDVNSTLGAGLAAVAAGLPTVHLEAGLRSNDRSMPEEHNRVLVDHLADVLLTHSRDADTNLAREGIPPERVKFVGNTMIDSLRTHESAARRLDLARSAYGLSDYLLVTLHRPALVDNAELLVEVMEVLETVATTRAVLFPAHPRTADRLRASGWSSSRVRLIPAQSYLRFLSLVMSASAVLTDSGGLQEETSVLGIPCFTLRANTERPITVAQGTNRVIGLDVGALRECHSALETSVPGLPRIPEGWDGRASERVADVLISRYDASADPVGTPALK